MHTKVCSGNLKGTDHLKGQVVDRRKTLN